MSGRERKIAKKITYKPNDDYIHNEKKKQNKTNELTL